MDNIYTLNFKELTSLFNEASGVKRDVRDMDELPQGFFEKGGPQDKYLAVATIFETLGHVPDKSERRFWELIQLETMEEVKEHGFTASEVMALYGKPELLQAVTAQVEELCEESETGPGFDMDKPLQIVKTLKRRCL